MKQRTKISGLFICLLITVLGFLSPTGNLAFASMMTLIGLIAAVAALIFFVLLFIREKK